MDSAAVPSASAAPAPAPPTPDGASGGAQQNTRVAGASGGDTDGAGGQAGAGTGVNTGAGAGAGAGAGVRRSGPLASVNEPFVRKPTGLVYDQRMRLHEDSSGPHPEQPARIVRIFNALQEAKLVERCERIKAREVERRELELVHTLDYVRKVASWSKLNLFKLVRVSYDYNSVFLNTNSLLCANLSCGSVVEAALKVCRGEMANAVAVVRPPGHHAEAGTAMGFCIYNNVAVAAAAALELPEVKRVLIVDWDVHHGNGTQHMFDDNPDVLYFSIHRYDNGMFYPGSPDAAGTQVGSGRGAGRNINVALSSGSKGDGDYIFVWNHVLLPLAHEFAPDLVLISAGFDAAYGDPLGGYKVTPPGYSHLTHMLKSLANGRIVVALEGGYNLDSISVSMAAVTRVLVGDDPMPLGRPVFPDRATQVAVATTLRAHAPHWYGLAKPGAPADIVESESDSSDSDSGDATDASSPDDGGKPSFGEPTVLEVPSAAPASEAAAAPAPAVASGSGTAAVTGAAADGGSGTVAADGGADGVTSLADVQAMLATQQGFNVHPLPHCEHVEANVSDAPVAVATNAKCQQCDEVGANNWVCLSCGVVLCGRYANSHMVEHGTKTGHAIVGSFGDFSFWCYRHESYINHYMMPRVYAWYERMHMDRFGALPSSSQVLTMEVTAPGPEATPDTNASDDDDV